MAGTGGVHVPAEIPQELHVHEEGDPEGARQEIHRQDQGGLRAVRFLLPPLPATPPEVGQEVLLLFSLKEKPSP